MPQEPFLGVILQKQGWAYSHPSLSHYWHSSVLDSFGIGSVP